MKLSSFWQNLAWDDWIYGLLYGAIGGGANAVYAGFGALAVDSHDFALGSAKSFKLIGWVFAFSAIMSAFLYLKQKPLPETKKREESVATVTQPGQPTITVATVKETTVIPKDSPS